MEAHRNLCTEKISKILKNNKISTKIEKSIFNFAIYTARVKGQKREWENKYFREMYNNKVRSILFNLRNKSELKEIILNKRVEIINIPYLNGIQMYPALYEEMLSKKLEKEILNMKLEEQFKEESGLFVCEKCKSDCTTSFSLQTRSADEPMTNYISCKKCGHNWKD